MNWASLRAVKNRLGWRGGGVRPACETQHKKGGRCTAALPTHSHTWKFPGSFSMKDSHSGVPKLGMSLDTTMAAGKGERGERGQRRW